MAKGKSTINPCKRSFTVSNYEFTMPYKELVEFLKEKGMPEPAQYGIDISVGSNSSGGSFVGNIFIDHNHVKFSIKRTENTNEHI